MNNNRKRCLLIGFCLIAVPLLIQSAADRTSGTVAGQEITDALVSAARTQIGKTVSYDPTYRTLKYPAGDVPIEAGVCTDVVIRALRSALNLDLQKLVHEDMQSHFSQYPRQWGLKKTDKNIDHRRVLNLQAYFKRQGYELPISNKPEDFKAGDLVTAIIPPNLPHIMIVSNKTTPITKRPLVIHNIGRGTREEDRLFEFKMTGHYRIARQASHRTF